MSSMSRLMCAFAAAAMIFSTSTLATADGDPCDEPLKPAPCNADIWPDGIVDIEDLLHVIESWNEVGDGSSRPPADIAPFDTGDCVVDISDLLMVLENWGADTSECSVPGACWLADNTCSVMEEDPCADAGGLSWVADADCTDTDSDRIPDVFELNDCSAPSNGFTGTDPTKADTDGDSLKDGDEIYGTTDGLDLPGYGCNACHKDLLIEVDWTAAEAELDNLNKFNSIQSARVVAAFANSPVTNPDGVTGIKLHVDIGQTPYSGGSYVADPDGDGNIEVDEDDGFDGGELPELKKDHFAANRNGIFHYCVMANSYSYIPDEGEDPTIIPSSGRADLPGDDFIVTLGQWGYYGNDSSIGNTFMHELGHNMNLKHSGSSHWPNNEPNFNSVMNYSYQFCGVDNDGDTVPDGVLDYSRGDNDDLDEDMLVEADGLNGEGPAIDWNKNGVIDTLPVSYNINCDFGLECSYLYSYSCGWSQDAYNNCYDTSCGTLTDNDDWAQLSFSGIEGLVPSVNMICDPFNLIDDE